MNLKKHIIDRLIVMKHDILTDKNGIKNEKNELRKEMVRLA